VDALIFPELIDDPLDQSLVNVVSAQVRVAVCRFHLDHALTDFQDRDVEGPAPEVEDRDGLVLLLVQAVSQRRRRRLIDYAQHVQAGDLAGVLGGLALRIVEVGRDSDDGLRDFLAQIIFGRLLQLLQYHGRDFRWRIFLPPGHYAHVSIRSLSDFVRNLPDLIADFIKPAAHEAFYRIDCIFRVGDRLTLRHLANQTVAVFGESHHRRRGAPPLRIGDNDRLTAFHNGDDRVGRA